jgi:predicted nucleic acid-binding protein
VNPVFADTFYLVALIHRKDASHQPVLEFSRGFSSLLVTTDEVLDGSSGFLLIGRSSPEECRTGRQAHSRGGHRARHPAKPPRLLDGLDLYEARADKGYSLADCISMQAMRREGLADVLTNDRHFEQVGFRAIFRST